MGLFDGIKGIYQSPTFQAVAPVAIGAGLAMTGVGAPAAAAMVGGGQYAMTGDLRKGLTAGIGAYGGAGIGGGLMDGAGASGGNALAKGNPEAMGGYGNVPGSGGWDASAHPFSENLSRAYDNAGNNAVWGQMWDNNAMKTYGAAGIGALGSGSIAADEESRRKLADEFAARQAASQTAKPNLVGPQPGRRPTMPNNPYYTIAPSSGEPRYFAGGGPTGIGSMHAPMSPRYIQGPGGGMDDAIPANIDGNQEARLSSGEFVVPADVVSAIGDGSSDAGAKKLHKMMLEIRHKKTGSGRQPPPL